MCNKARPRLTETPMPTHGKPKDPANIQLLQSALFRKFVEGYLSVQGDFRGDIVPVDRLKTRAIELDAVSGSPLYGHIEKTDHRPYKGNGTSQEVVELLRGIDSSNPCFFYVFGQVQVQWPLNVK